MADITAKAELKKIERAMVRLRNKCNRADLEYTVQITITSVRPTIVSYAAQLTPVAEGLAPLTFIAPTSEELVAKIKASTKSIDHVAIEKAYHEAQINAAEHSIKAHKERITELDNPETHSELGEIVKPEEKDGEE